MTNPDICTISHSFGIFGWSGGALESGLANDNYLQDGGRVAAIQLEDEQVSWRKARRSVGNGACVEIAALKGDILVRDSKLSNSPVISFPDFAWQAFLSGTKAQ